MVVGSKRKRNRTRATRRVRQRTDKFRGAGSGPVPRGLSTAAGQNGIAAITRSVELLNQIQTGGSDLLDAFSFQLSDLPGYTAFSALYDQYRILAVKVEFVPVNLATTTNNAGSITNTPSPILHTCIDLDDATTPTAAVVLSHQTYKCHGAYTPASATKYVRWLQPAVAMDVYQGAFGGFASKTNQWIDAASPGVAHYGLKAWLEMPTGSVNTRVHMYATYYMEFRLPF
jgi:hypothetical protein